MNTVELRQWAIEQAVGLQRSGRDARELARDFLDFVNENNDATIAAAARRLADKANPTDSRMK